MNAGRLAVAVGLVLMGCAEPGPVQVPTEPRADVLSPSEQVEDFATTDEEWAWIARHEVPGFAGVYFASDGTQVILLTDLAQGPEAKRVLEGRIGTFGREAPGVGLVRYQAVQYDFAQLKSWADRMAPAFESEAVFMIDVDEVRNRVVVGVQDEATARDVLAQATEQGVPAQAVVPEVMEKPEAYNLQAYTATLMGGYQIAGKGICTFGFNAIFDGNPVFVTNSHCTASQFSSTDGSAIYQPDSFSGVIGYEVKDIAPKPCYPYVDPCRDSDAAYIAHDPNAGRTIAQGNIARTNRPPWAGVSTDPTTVYTPPHRVTHVYTTPVVTGMILDKVGRTTGQTWGQVTKSCINIDVGSFFLRCQDAAYLGADSGDSGSPVFQRLESGYDVALVGILWGGSGTDTYTSRITGIEADLGTLNSLCISGYSC